jgi:hypothetical protein
VTPDVVVTSRAMHIPPDFHPMRIPEAFASCTRLRLELGTVRELPTCAFALPASGLEKLRHFAGVPWRSP